MTVEVECRVRHCGGDFGAPLPTVEMTVEVEYRVRHCGEISGLPLN